MGIAEQRQADRIRVLVTVYDMTGGRQMEVVNDRDVARVAGMTEADMNEAVQFLLQREFLSGFLGGDLYLTDTGMEAAERALTSPAQPAATGMAPAQVVIVSGTGNIVQQGTGPQQMSNVEARCTIQQTVEAKNIAVALRELLGGMDRERIVPGADHDLREQLRAQVEALEVELKESSPRRDMVKAAFASAHRILESAAGSAAFATVGPSIQAALEVLQHIHL